MIWNEHSRLEGLHSMFSPSQPSWLNYDNDKLITVCKNMEAKRHGTELHSFAASCIKLGQRLPKRPVTTLSMYVNDAITYKMRPEQPLFYSSYFFGTSDAIVFDEKKSVLRIHDLKTGTIPGKMEQLLVYDALFCLEYGVDPTDIQHELRIYQDANAIVHTPYGDDIYPIMDKIVTFNDILLQLEEANE